MSKEKQEGNKMIFGVRKFSKKLYLPFSVISETNNRRKLLNSILTKLKVVSDNPTKLQKFIKQLQ